MVDYTQYSVGFSAVALGLTAVSAVAGIVFPLALMIGSNRKATFTAIEDLKTVVNKRVEELSHAMAAHEMEDMERFSEVRETIDVKGDMIRREFGETGAALRQQMHGLELSGKDAQLAMERSLTDARHTIYSRIEQQHAIHQERTDELELRVRGVEVSQASSGSRHRTS